MTKQISPEQSFLKQLLRDSEYSRDALPYSDEFTRLKKEYSRKLNRRVSDADFWHLLTRVGKRGGLGGRKRRRQGDPIALTTEQQLELLRLMPDGIGNRDRLPYTDEFDELHRRFNRWMKGAKLTKHEFWRALARVGKRSRKPQPLFETTPLGGLPADLVELLAFQNPWWRGEPAKPTEPFRRWAFYETFQRLQSNLTPIVAIRGPRQVGKTTIQEQLIEELLKLRGVKPSRIFRIQFDEVPSLGSFRDPILVLVRWFEQNILNDTLNGSAQRGEPVYLFFDEVQNLKTWAPQIKSLVDHAKAKTLITGSSALRIAGGQDSLAGRISTLELGPLRLHEIPGVRRTGELPAFSPESGIDAWTEQSFWIDLLKHASRHQRVIEQAFRLFSEVGGYPVCHKPDAQRSTLSELIIKTVVERTIIHDLKAGPQGRRRDPGVLRETFRRVCRYAGQSVQKRRIKEEVEQVLGTGIREKAIGDAVDFLSNSLLIHEIPPLEALTKRQHHPPKICLCDHFVREAWLQETVPIAPKELANVGETVCTVAGHMIESTLGYSLKGIPGLDVSWFPSRHNEPEVDFVLTIGLHRVPIEVKYSRSKPKQSDLKGLKSFCSQAKYNAKFGILVTQDVAGPIDDNVIAVPAYAMLIVR